MWSFALLSTSHENSSSKSLVFHPVTKNNVITRFQLISCFTKCSKLLQNWSQNLRKLIWDSTSMTHRLGRLVMPRNLWTKWYTRSYGKFDQKQSTSRAERTVPTSGHEQFTFYQERFSKSAFTNLLAEYNASSQRIERYDWRSNPCRSPQSFTSSSMCATKQIIWSAKPASQWDSNSDYCLQNSM